jgi:hypothetical protein
MKTKSSSPGRRNRSNPPENQVPDPKLLLTLAEEMETDENVEKLAEKLAEEWNKPTNENEAPSLPFSKFLDKLDEKRDQ